MTKDKTKLRLLSDVTDTILKKSNFKKNKNLIDSDLKLTRTNKTPINEEIIQSIKLPDLKLQNIYDKKDSQKQDNMIDLNQPGKVKKDSFLKQNISKNFNVQLNDFSPKENKIDFVDQKKEEKFIEALSLGSNPIFHPINQQNKKLSKNNSKNNKKIKNSSNKSNLKKITILIDEQAINKKVSELHKEATSYSLLKIKKNKKTELLNNNSKLISISNSVLNQDIPLKTSELITYSNNNYNFNKEPYPFSLDNIEVLSADRKSPNYKEFSNLKNLNEIEKEKLELIKKKYGLKKEIKTLIDQSNDFSFKNKFLTEKLFLDSNKKKEVLKTVLEESKVNPNYDSLRHQIGKLTIYLENLKTLLNDVEFDISINNLNIDEGSEIIQDLESKIYIAQFLLDKLRNKN